MSLLNVLGFFAFVLVTWLVSTWVLGLKPKELSVSEPELKRQYLVKVENSIYEYGDNPNAMTTDEILEFETAENFKIIEPGLDKL